jgi:anaerobic glycerol-3-phosphate dehydrogenase
MSDKENAFDELSDAILPKADENGDIELPSIFGEEDETYKTNRNGMKDMISTMLKNQLEWGKKNEMS